MKKLSSGSASAAVAFCVLAACFASFAHADERHGGGRGGDRGGDRRGGGERERYQTPHVVYDNRFHHNHYYPQIGYGVAALPAGRVEIRFGGSPFFFHSGVWYRRSGPRFIVARPPIGIVVPMLPPAYSTVVVAGAPYYYANDVYYVQRPDGYAVVDQPEGDMVEAPAPMAPPAPQAAAPGAAAQSAPNGIWYYCESSKTYYPYVSECREGWKQVPATPQAPR